MAFWNRWVEVYQKSSKIWEGLFPFGKITGKTGFVRFPKMKTIPINCDLTIYTGAIIFEYQPCHFFQIRKRKIPKLWSLLHKMIFWHYLKPPLWHLEQIRSPGKKKNVSAGWVQLEVLCNKEWAWNRENVTYFLVHKFMERKVLIDS